MHQIAYFELKKCKKKKIKKSLVWEGYTPSSTYFGISDQRVMCLKHLSIKRAVELHFLLKFWIDSASKIHQKYVPDRLFWTLKMQKIHDVGGGHPLPHPLHIFPRLLDRRIMCLMHPLEGKAGRETFFLLKFWIDNTPCLYPYPVKLNVALKEILEVQNSH